MRLNQLEAGSQEGHANRLRVGLRAASRRSWGLGLSPLHPESRRGRRVTPATSRLLHAPMTLQSLLMLFLPCDCQLPHQHLLCKTESSGSVKNEVILYADRALRSILITYMFIYSLMMSDSVRFWGQIGQSVGDTDENDELNARMHPSASWDGVCVTPASCPLY